MQGQGAFTDLDSLEAWFKQANASVWSLYYNFQKNNVQRGQCFMKQDEELEMEDSWHLLRSTLERASQSGGKFTVILPTTNSKYGFRALVALNVPAYGQNRGIQGINGALGMVSQSEMDRRLAEAEERWELRRKVEDLEEMLEAGKPSWQPVIEGILEKLDPNAIAGLVMNGLAAKTHSVPPQIQGMPMTDHNVTIDLHDPRILDFLSTTRAMFEDDETYYAMLERAKGIFVANPDLVKTNLNG